MRFACVENSYYDAWARTGLGCGDGLEKSQSGGGKGDLGLIPHQVEEFIKVAWKSPAIDRVVAIFQTLQELWQHECSYALRQF